MGCHTQYDLDILYFLVFYWFVFFMSLSFQDKDKSTNILIAFAQSGWLVWPTMSDPFTNHATNLIHMIVILQFAASIFVISILWDALQSDVLKCYKDMADVYFNDGVYTHYVSGKF